MPETSKRRREKYSKLICLGCRARRIRCALPDTSIQPSPQPQPQDKACHRCRQNGLDCIVDSTTLGRPAQKRNRVDQSLNVQQTIEQNDSHDGDSEEGPHNVEDFLLSHPEIPSDDVLATKIPQPPTKSEMFDACFSPFHLLPTLLSRDKKFASMIGSQPMIIGSVIELVDDRFTELLDAHLIWHKVYFPDIPPLAVLRSHVKSLERGQSEYPSSLFLLTLLYDLALDVPSAQLEACRYLQPAVRALLFHTGQQLLFSLSHSSHAVLALVLAANYRPLAFTSSQLAAANALKAVPYTVLAKQVATELGYSSAGLRLTEALQSFGTQDEEILPLIYECLHWIRLSMAGISLESVFRMQTFNETTFQCLEALNNASLLGRMPIDVLLPYTTTACWIHMLMTYKDLSENWRDLKHLGETIYSHKAWCEREKDVLEAFLASTECPKDKRNAISHLVEGELHLAHVSVAGAAMFFAVMFGAYAATNQKAIQPNQAVEISNHIIKTLLAHDEEDPNRTSHRKFLEEHGHDRMDKLEAVLSNFITAADTLTLNGISHVASTRTAVSFILLNCKDIVEGQAARLKGWGGLHHRVEVQMILFHECARRLESMSATAGTEEAMAKGCILTASARLIRSLHRIMQGFNRAVAMNQRAARSTTESTKAEMTPDTDALGLENVVSNESTSGLESLVSDDLFADWDNWPQFNPFDFADLFPEVFTAEDASGTL